MPPRPQSNFDFLGYHDPRLVVLGAQAERQFAEFPVACIATLRLFGELLAQRAAAKLGVLGGPQDRQVDILARLSESGALRAEPRTLFHDLRSVGNAAVHEGKGDHREALHQLKQARTLGVWFQRSFGNNRKFDPGPFIPPPDPAQEDQALRLELQRLHDDLERHKGDLEAQQAALQAEAQKRLTLEQLAAQAAEERALWEALAAEESQRAKDAQSAFATLEATLAAVTASHAAELSALQAAAAAATPAVQQDTIDRAAEAGSDLELDELATRRIIDEKLRAAGWEVDSDKLTDGKGARPARGVNRAIAEWYVGGKGKKERADYVLFVGLTAVGVVEAKRKGKDVSQALLQAERYSQAWVDRDDAAPPEGGPWGQSRLCIPFLFASNGRDFLPQIKEKSGIWFRDGRRDQNLGDSFAGWFSPEGLLERLKQDVSAAHAKLAAEPFDYLGLRDYQVRAIQAVEAALVQSDLATRPAEKTRSFLVAMATGTGKTRTAIGMVYRLLKSKRFRRVLFLVDRTALGEQTANAFKDARLENLQTFAEIFDLKELGDTAPDSDTKLQIATIQSMVLRILAPQSPTDMPPIDQFDCIVVDECHRGYGLDREMSDVELTFRNQDDYISKFRRVLDYFDAVKVGLTATPALHTLQIFGSPVFRYTYPEAVVDGNLIDHEPPVRIVTQLAEDGIHWRAGAEVAVYVPKSSTVDLIHLQDEVDVEIDSFNKRVITESFNRVVAAELARFIDPNLPGKTLVFAANDLHADMLVRLLKEAFAAEHGAVEDQAVVKITGTADQPLRLIRRYKNERLPSVAVTVDLLTTGIDVPEIVNIVFLRRVRSRILYEQMMGRATRLCKAIDKVVFRVFDAVDLYAALEDYTDMRPVAAAPKVPFAQLIDDLRSLKDQEARELVLKQLIAKLRRRKGSFDHNALAAFEVRASLSPDELLETLRRSSPDEAVAWFDHNGWLIPVLDQVVKADRPLYVSDHEDSLRRTERGYGTASKPEDYLAGFVAFIQGNMNRLPALTVVAQRPRELTRKQLKEVELELANAGYTEARLRTAWQEQTNVDIAATILGWIRQAALGNPLEDYGARVDKALQKIMARQKWTPPQAEWLKRLGKQLKQQKVLDREALSSGAFENFGGFDRINKTFDGKVEELLGDLADALWKDAG